MCNSVVEHNYRILCDLYSIYTTLVSNMCSDSYTNYSYYIDDVLRQIESYPITWKFYANQRFKFSQDFEDLVIFIDSDYINNNG